MYGRDGLPQDRGENIEIVRGGRDMGRKEFKFSDTLTQEISSEETSKGLPAKVAEELNENNNTAQDTIEDDGPATKLEFKKTEPGQNRVSCIISDRAKRNLDKYAELYGYEKKGPFINALLEHLDAYL